MSGSASITTETSARLQVPNEDEKSTLVDISTRDLGILPIPKHLRYDPAKPPHFGFLLNILFGLASTFTIANLYWCQPLLIQLAQSFNVSYGDVSRVPTLLQAGYAAGLLFISPLGDLVRRRQLILALVFCSSTLTIGIAVTSNLVAFEVLSFLVGVVTVTPQILLPLAADLAPPERRASAMALVLSGLMFGILVARVLSGIIAQFTYWRVVYYMSIGVQYALLACLYFFIPDYPAKNDNLTYWNVLFSMAKYTVTEPVLIQGSILMMASCACYTNFWVTLTFLLGGEPYNYSTLVIGLFGVIGIAGVSTGPFLGILIDRLVPWYSTMFSTVWLTLFQAIETGAGGINVAAVVIVTFGLDVARQMQQVSITTAVFSVAPEARSRLNAVLILSAFIGQVMGTAVGTKVFVEHGWRAASWVCMAWWFLQIAVLLMRGPHVRRFTWFGFEGGFEARKSIVEEKRKNSAELEAPASQDEKQESNPSATSHTVDDRKVENSKTDPTTNV